MREERLLTVAPASRTGLLHVHIAHSWIRVTAGEAIVLEALAAGHPFAAAHAAAGQCDEAQLAVEGARIVVTACARGLVLRVRLAR